MNWVQEALEYLGNDKFTALSQSKHMGTKERARLLLAFTSLNDVSITKIKIAALKDKSPVVRQSAIESISVLGNDSTLDTEVISALRKGCNDHDMNVRIFASKALSRLGDIQPN